MIPSRKTGSCSFAGDDSPRTAIVVSEPASMLTYDVVMATRNRPEAVRLSIPLLLAQNRKPKQLIVVDASDDPAPTSEVLERFTNREHVPCVYMRSKAGTSTQRNLGLQRVTSDIVFFPDDDSLVFPGALEAMMRIYELDEEGVIGGVCSAEALDAPEGILSAARQSYRMGLADTFRRSIGKTRYALERMLVPDPFSVYAHHLYAARRHPKWLQGENAVLVDRMTGFRMSFRTDLIRRSGFDETLGRYALGEDIDAGFSVIKTHFLVGARNAQIYHHKMPGARDGARRMGAMHIVNRAYILAKHAQPDSPAFQYLSRFCLYKIALYATRIDSRSGRDRLAGAWAAYRQIPELLSASRQDLSAAYRAALRSSLGETAQAEIV